MKTHNRFYFTASVMILTAILLPQSAASSARARAGSAIFSTEHTIAGNFDGAYSVYATDVDGDGDVDVLGATSQ